jgi:small basic protein (TIGR04137 family)
MSIHKSLATKGKLVRTRNVLKRAERIIELTKTGRWKPETNSPFGLPKVRVLKVKKRAKEKKKEEGAEGAAATEGAAAPAAGGKAAAPAAGGKAAAPAAAAKAPAGKEGKK